MKSTNVFYVFGILLATVSVVRSATTLKSIAVNCECGVAASIQLKEGEIPIITRPADRVIECPDVAMACNLTCADMAHKEKEKGPMIICAIHNGPEPFIPSLYYRSCNDKWTYSGLTCQHPICCKDNQAIQCPNNTVNHNHILI